MPDHPTHPSEPPRPKKLLEALRTQFPLLVLELLTKFFKSPKWRERIKQSFGYDPLLCPRCGRTLELAEIWEPQYGHIKGEALARNGLR